MCVGGEGVVREKEREREREKEKGRERERESGYIGSFLWYASVDTL